MRPRYQAYAQVLSVANEMGYRACSVLGFWEAMREGSVGERPQLVLRHDVDTDPDGARRFLDIEQANGCHSSFYFRLSTLDIALMQEIDEAGSEASYHYEELATFAKSHAIRERAKILEHLPTIRQTFESNYQRIRDGSGCLMRTVASHGDFANRHLGLANSVILDDQALRERLSIVCETYDKAMTAAVTSRFTDEPRRPNGSGDDLLEALRQRKPVVYFLTHPRHWRAHVRSNLVDDVNRMYEGALFRLGIPLRVPLVTYRR